MFLIRDLGVQLLKGFQICLICLACVVANDGLLGQSDLLVVDGYITQNYVSGPRGWLFIPGNAQVLDSVPCGRHEIFQLGNIELPANRPVGVLSPFGEELIPARLVLPAYVWEGARSGEAVRFRNNFCSSEKRVPWSSYLVRPEIQEMMEAKVMQDYLEMVVGPKDQQVQ